MTRDGHIRVLPIHVANKIAAGEVVERPASVLKELLENAVDAGANRIEVTAVQGGRKLVSVRDDGCGMTREDAVLSLERQATSKIRDVDDIERISTLGFRGEAIPSIASVSRFTLVTRRAESDAATRIVVNAGTLAEVTECGAPPGTCVEVRDLFCNVPARRKFLRAYATEETHVREVFTTHALAHPDVGFTLTIDGREAYRLPPGATLGERLSGLFGRDLLETLAPLGTAETEGDAATVSVHGYVAKPGLSAVRAMQYVFVNGRPATAPTIAYAVKEAYPRARDEARPALFLFIDLPPEDVDVNVHPAKREVRFRKPADVKAAIESAIADALGAAPLAAPEPQPTVLQPTPAPVQFSLPVQTAVPAAAATLPGPTVAPSVPVAPVPPAGSEAPAAAPLPPADAAAGVSAVPPASRDVASGTGPWRSFTYLTQTASGYILVETDAGLVTINPQAAQERIAYERLMAAAERATDQTVSQPLLIPETIRLSPVESARLRSFRDILEGMGFALDDFGSDTWKIDAVPALLAETAAAETLRSIAFDIAEQGERKGGARWREERVAKSIAKAFAGRPRRLSDEDATRITTQLAACRMPYVCPRGKPVMIFMSNRELARKFARP